MPDRLLLVLIYLYLNLGVLTTREVTLVLSLSPLRISAVLP